MKERLLEIQKNHYNSLSEEDKKKFKEKRNWYDNLSPEEKEAHAQRTRDQLANRTEEEWKIINKKNSEGVKRHWNSMNKDDRLKRITPMQQAAWKQWETMTTEEKYKRATSWLNNKTEDEQAVILQMYSNKMLEYNNSLSLEEKQNRAKLMNEFNNKLSEKDKKDLYEKSHRWIKELSREDRWKYYRNQLELMKHSVPPTSTELFLINELRINGFEYKFNFQYVNRIVTNEFIDKYPDVNNPYHIWDFMISTRRENILIDIDGRIHTVLPGKLFSKDGKDIGKEIQFKDSQRPYQTDGLEAYIILAYDDKIEKDTPVLSIKTGEIINYTQLMGILQVLNMSKKELRKLIK